MDKRKLRNYFSKMIKNEEIPAFDTVKPFLKETGKSFSSAGDLKASFIFCSVFVCFLAVMVTSGFFYHSLLPDAVALEYHQSGFAIHAKEKIERAQIYLLKVNYYQKGGK